MDTTTTDDITHRLGRYVTAVQETRDHASERSSFGRYRAGAPYFEQHSLRAALASYGGDTALTGALPDEYERINTELDALERDGGRVYREELFRDLSAYTEAYRTMLCYHELGMCDAGEIANHPLRGEIGILLVELQGDFPTADIGRVVALLDDALRNIRGAACTVPPVQDTPEGAAGTSDPLWQQYPRARTPKERAGFR